MEISQFTQNNNPPSLPKGQKQQPHPVSGFNLHLKPNLGCDLPCACPKHLKPLPHSHTTFLEPVVNRSCPTNETKTGSYLPNRPEILVVEGLFLFRSQRLPLSFSSIFFHFSWKTGIYLLRLIFFCFLFCYVWNFIQTSSPVSNESKPDSNETSPVPNKTKPPDSNKTRPDFRRASSV